MSKEPSVKKKRKKDQGKEERKRNKEKKKERREVLAQREKKIKRAVESTCGLTMGPTRYQIFTKMPIT